MSEPAATTRLERLRLFIALSLDDAVRERVAAWQQREIAGRPGVRVVSRENLHITLVFLGSRPATDVPAIAALMHACIAEEDGQEASAANTGARCPTFRVSRYRETSRVGLIALREERAADEVYAGRAAALTGRLMLSLEARGLYRREPRDWVPHVTVARFRTAPGLGPPLPDLGSFSPSGVVLYQSVSGVNGSEYVPIDAVDWTA